MKWPWSPRETKMPTTSMRGVKENGVKVDAPSLTATDQQWIDFAAVVALMTPAWEMESPSVTLTRRQWRERAFRAYNAKWGGA